MCRIAEPPALADKARQARFLSKRNRAANHPAVQSLGEIIVAAKRLNDLVDDWLETHDGDGAEYTDGLRALDVAFQSAHTKPESVCVSILDDLRAIRWAIGNARDGVVQYVPPGLPGTFESDDANF